MEDMTNGNNKCNSNCVSDNNINPIDSEQRKLAIRNALQILNTSQEIQNNWNKYIRSPNSEAQRRTYAKVIAPGEENIATFSRCNSDSMLNSEYDFNSTVYEESNQEINSNVVNNCNNIDCKEQSAKSNSNDVSTNVCAHEVESTSDKSKSETENKELVQSEASVTDMPYKRYKAKRPEWLRIKRKAQRYAQAAWQNKNHKNNNIQYTSKVNEENTNYENNINYRKNNRKDDGTFDNITNRNLANTFSTTNGARSDGEQNVLTQKNNRCSKWGYDSKFQDSTTVVPTEHQYRIVASKEMTQFNLINENHNKSSDNNVNVVRQRQQSVTRIPDNHAMEINDSVIYAYPYYPTCVKWKNHVDYAGNTANDRTLWSNNYINKGNADDKETKNRWKTNYPETQYLPSNLTTEIQSSHLSSSFSHLSTSSSSSSSTAPTAHRYSAPVITHRFTDYDVVKQKYPFVINNKNYDNVRYETQLIEPQIRLSVPQEHTTIKHHTEHNEQEEFEKKLLAANSRREQESLQPWHQFVGQRHTQPFRSHMNHAHVPYAQQEQLEQNIPFVEYNHQSRAKLCTDTRSQNELATVINLNDSRRNNIASHNSNNYSKASLHNVFSPLQLHVSSTSSSSLLLEHSLTKEELEDEKFYKSKESNTCEISRPPRLHSRSAAWFAAILQNISGCNDKNVNRVKGNKENKEEKESDGEVANQHHSSNEEVDDVKRENSTSDTNTSNASFASSVITNNNNIIKSNSIFSNWSNSKSQEFERKNSNSMSLFVHTMPSLMQQQEQQEESLSCQLDQRLNSSVFTECSLLNLSNTLPSLLQCYDNERNNNFDNVNRYEYDTISLLNDNNANDDNDENNAAISDKESIPI